MNFFGKRLVRIRGLVGFAGVGLTVNVGDVLEVDPAVAAEHIAAGRVELTDEPEGRAPTHRLSFACWRCDGRSDYLGASCVFCGAPQ